MTTEPVGLRVLVIDDERPALDELAFLLERDPRVHGVLTSDSATDALRVLQDLSVDAVFLDISMPGLSGLELAQVLARFKTPPPVVFVTAHEQHAVEAFELNAVDYVLKPVREERLAEAVRRVVEGTHPARAAEDDQVAVELGGVTRFISRADITYVEAQGDYARLHTADGSHLLRTPLATLEQEWQAAGFVRIHRSLLVSLPHVDEVRTEAGRCTVVVDGTELAVSRRHTRALRDLLVRRNRPGGHDDRSPSAVRVTSPRTTSGRRLPPPSAAHEIDAQSQVGEVYLRSLLRAQLRLAVVVVGSSPSSWAGCRCCSGCCPR